MDKNNKAGRSRQSNTTQGKMAPHDKDAEEVVLGSLIFSPKTIHLVHAMVKPDAFYYEHHQKICHAILSLYISDKAVDIISVKHELTRLGCLEEVGGYFKLMELNDRVASTSNIGEHIAIINYTYQLRQLVGFGTGLINNAYDVGNDPFNLITEGVQFLDSIKNMNVRRTEKSMDELLNLMFLEINRPKIDGLLGISSGSSALDSITKGWQPGQLIIPAARPAMGKTADLCSQVAHVGYRLKKPVGVFSLEMSSVQLTFRIAANLSEIPQTNLKLNNLSQVEVDRLAEWIEKLRAAPIYMDETAGISIDELEAKASLWKALYGIEALYIDYLQLITIKGGRPGNREADVSEISRRLKSLAKNLQIPVIALCQLSRAVEGRDKDNFLPKLSDLRESGSIEQDADVVYFLWRPEYYGLTQMVSFPKFNLQLDPKNLIVKKVAKCREEEPGLVPNKFTGNIMKVADHPSYVGKVVSPEIGFNTNADDSEPPF